MTGRKGLPCVVSVAEHTGWAYLVCVSQAGHVPVVVDRRRVTLIDAGLPTMPYEHDAIGMQEDEANALIARVRRSAAARATLALQRVVNDLSPAYTIVALAIRKPPCSELPGTVAEVWRSHRLKYSADGMLYQLAMCRAASDLGLDVALCRRGVETARAAEELGVTVSDVESFVTGSGRPSGPPWTQEHRRAYAAGIAALRGHVRRLAIPTV